MKSTEYINKTRSIFTTIVVLFCTCFFASPAIAQNSLINQLRLRLSNYALQENQLKLNAHLKTLNKDDYNGDQVILQLYQRRSANTNAVEKLLKNFNEDGTWTDINYNDTDNSGWDLRTHANRILLLTKEYLSTESKYYHDNTVSQKIHLALGYWFKHMPQNANWWYNKIGIPKILGEAIVLLKPELSKSERTDALRVMNQSDFGMTGQNKVWLAGNMFFKALLTDDEKLARQARDTIVSEIIISANEGIQADYSYQQHGPQQQFGNYGLAYITTMASWANIFNNTALQLSNKQLDVLGGLFNQGFNQIVWKGRLDINSLGRQFFKQAPEQKALALGFAAYDLLQVDPKHNDVYLDFMKRNFSGTMLPELKGITNYYRSDMTVYRDKDWYNSIKMSSTRVIGAETGNNENLKGYYLGDGASYISVSGKEYTDIFPLWNWRNLPGVTCYETSKALKQLTFKGYRNNDDFAGSISNGLNGVTAFVLNRDSLTAKKAYFYIEGQMVCLGSGISSLQNDSVVTTMNQTWLNGEVTYFNEGENLLSPESTVSKQEASWVYHDNITYVPLMKTLITISNETHTGSWSNIIAKYPKDSISGKIFTIKVTAELKPVNADYAYAILPNEKPAVDGKTHLKFEVLENSSEAQVVKSKNSNHFLIVAYQPCKIQDAALGTVAFEQPGLYQIEKINHQWEITLADPTHKLKTMAVVFKNKSYTFKLPVGLFTGKAVHKKL